MSNELYCYIARYTDVWNRHRESEIHDIHEIGSGTKLFITFELKVFRPEERERERERETIFLCWLLLHRQLSTQPTRDARSTQSRLASPRSESRLSRSEAGTQLTDFFSNPQHPQPTLPVHVVIHSSWSYFLSGILFWHLGMKHPPRVRVNTCAHVCT